MVAILPTKGDWNEKKHCINRYAGSRKKHNRSNNCKNTGISVYRCWPCNSGAVRQTFERNHSWRGTEGFVQVENDVNKSLNPEKAVISTGGSVVYCTEAMEHLSEIATIVYLKLDLYSLERRLGNLKQRGVVLKEGQTLKDLYDERCPLYEKYADIVISENHCSVEKTVDKVVTKLRQSGF